MMSNDTTTIAVLSWAWAAVAVEPARPARWLAAHPADASLAAHLADQLTPQRSGACRY